MTRIFAQLEQTFPSLDIVGYNVSISGNTTRMALERMAYDLQPYRPDAVYVQFGLNDCNHWVSDGGVPRTNQRSFACNLAEIIDRCRASGASTILIGTNHPSAKTGAFPHIPLVYENQNIVYNEIIRQVAAETGAVLVDHEAAWKDAIRRGASLDALLHPDGIHLALPGHDLYYETLIPHMTRCVTHLPAGSPVAK